MSVNSLFFDYPDTSRIRIKRENCLQAPEWPCLYGIVTKKLSFTVPRAAVILTEKYVYIPLSVYRTQLIKYYSSIKSPLCT